MPQIMKIIYERETQNKKKPKATTATTKTQNRITAMKATVKGWELNDCVVRWGEVFSNEYVKLF